MPRWRAVSLAALAALALLIAGREAAGKGKGAKEAAEAREHVEKAGRHFDLDEFQKALEEYKEAYRLKADPALLFNIARCHHKLGQREEAASFYGKYLSKAKAAAKGGTVPREELVRRWIAELEGTPDAGAAPDAGPAASVAVAPPAPAHRRFTVIAQASASERDLARQSREAVEQALTKAGHELVSWKTLGDAAARVLGAPPRANDAAWAKAAAKAKLDQVVLCTVENAGLLVGFAKRQYSVEVVSYDASGARTKHFSVELGQPKLDDTMRAAIARELR